MSFWRTAPVQRKQIVARGIRYGWLVGMSAVSFCAGQSLLRAQDAEIRWAGPACTDSESLFRARLRAFLRQGEEVGIRGEIRASAIESGTQVSMRVALPRGGTGERSFLAANCTLAAETSALIVAMAAYPERTFVIDAGSAVNTTPGIDDGGTLLVDAEMLPVKEKGKSQNSEALDGGILASAPRDIQLRVGVLGTGEWNVLPTGAVGGSAEVGVGIGRRLSFGLQGGLTFVQSREFGGGRGADLQSVPFGVRGCYAPLVSSWARADLCAAWQGIWLRGTGSGFDVSRDGDLFYFAPAAAIDLSLRPWQFLEWRIESEVAFPLSRKRFLVDGQFVSQAGIATLTLRTGPVFLF